MTHLLVVVNEENRLRAMNRLGGHACLLGHRRARVGARKVNAEGGSFARFAFDVDVATTLLHDAEHGGETEARAFALRLGGEEGLEDSG